MQPAPKSCYLRNGLDRFDEQYAHSTRKDQDTTTMSIYRHARHEHGTRTLRTRSRQTHQVARSLTTLKAQRTKVPVYVGMFQKLVVRKIQSQRKTTITFQTSVSQYKQTCNNTKFRIGAFFFNTSDCESFQNSLERLQ